MMYRKQDGTVVPIAKGGARRPGPTGPQVNAETTGSKSSPPNQPTPPDTLRATSSSSFPWETAVTTSPSPRPQNLNLKLRIAACVATQPDVPDNWWPIPAADRLQWAMRRRAWLGRSVESWCSTRTSPMWATTRGDH